MLSVYVDSLSSTGLSHALYTMTFLSMMTIYQRWSMLSAEFLPQSMFHNISDWQAVRNRVRACEWKEISMHDMRWSVQVPSFAQCSFFYQQRSFVFHRVGPVNLSKPHNNVNEELNRVTGHNGYMVTWPITREQRVWRVVGGSSWAEDSFGRTLGYPGLYYHHVHILFAKNTSELRATYERRGQPDCIGHHRLVALAHGDSICSEDSGGMACLHSRWAPFALVTSQQLFFDVYVTDQDSHTADSLYLFVGLEDATNVTRVRPMYYFNALISTSTELLGDTLFGNYYVRSRFTMVFTESVTPISGRMIYSTSHSHLHMMDDMFLVAGSARAISLGYNRSFERYINRAVKSFGTQTQLLEEKRRIIRQTDLCQSVCTGYACSSVCPRVVCKTAQLQDRFDVLGGIAYERYSPPLCTPWHFEAGDPFVVIAFNSPAGRSKPALPFSQHSIFRIFVDPVPCVTPDPPVPVMYQVGCPSPRYGST